MRHASATRKHETWRTTRAKVHASGGLPHSLLRSFSLSFSLSLFLSLSFGQLDDELEEKSSPSVPKRRKCKLRLLIRCLSSRSDACRGRGRRADRGSYGGEKVTPNRRCRRRRRGWCIIDGSADNVCSPLIGTRGGRCAHRAGRLTRGQALASSSARLGTKKRRAERGLKPRLSSFFHFLSFEKN